MKSFLIVLLLIVPSPDLFSQQSDSTVIRSIYTEALDNGKGYEWLRDLTQHIGHRLSGSPEAAKAVVWAEKLMIEAGADSVWLQKVMVPHWVRGAKEKGVIIDGSNHSQQVTITALGNSVATPDSGITAPIIEVHDFSELPLLGKENIQGKIVFYNHPFDQAFVNTFHAYGEAVEYRWSGPSEAARYGAVATVCRSMTNSTDDVPHTGAMDYNDSLPEIPCVAISTTGADLLSRIIRADKGVKFFMQMNCRMLDSATSYNVIGEIKGRSHPEEIIVNGGHLDSWDVGQGAHDDGAGVVQAVEVLRLFKTLGIKPERTVRAVAFMNEENGLRGGVTYAARIDTVKEKHIAAIESDAGGFTPMGFGLDMSEAKKLKIQSWKPLFIPYNVWSWDQGHGGADIGPMKRRLQVPQIGLAVDSQRYFDYHHSPADTFDKVNRRELLLGTATMASLTYLLAMYGL
ncbi:MAG: M20/M25/M40 family metallo-hydrolase [Bacteroidia bacterium]|nr:M20/M25/M40 family metallo-hydrolase [Bacteroidia bacterium]